MSGHRFVVAEPAAQAELWAAYLAGARRRYREHGVECAVEYEDIRDGRSIALFITSTADHGRVVGGLRVPGRLCRADPARALREWAGRRPGTAQLTAQIAQRLPCSVIEIEAVWVDHDAEHRAALTAAMARAFVHAMDLFRVRYALCTAATHAVTRWRSSGGVVGVFSGEVAAVANPDQRYRTVLIWWDRARIAGHVSVDQHAAPNREHDRLRGRSVALPPLSSVA